MPKTERILLLMRSSGMEVILEPILDLRASRAIKGC